MCQKAGPFSPRAGGWLLSDLIGRQEALLLEPLLLQPLPDLGLTLSPGRLHTRVPSAS